MKLLIILVSTSLLLGACNLQEGIKETGDAVQGGAQNVVEAAKEAPADISKALNKVEADIKK